MNIVLIVVIAILAGCVIAGYSRGFLRIVYSLVAGILVFAFVYFATPHIKNFIIEKTNIDERIETYCEETVHNPVKTQIRENSEVTVENSIEELEKQMGLEELGINLPESVMEDIAEQASGAANDFLEDSGVYTAVSKGMADFILQGISFFIAFITGTILSIVISCVLGIVSKIPILSGANRTLGLFAGAVQGLLIVWVAFYLIAICSASEAGATLVSYIYSNKFLTFLYENNLIVTLINIYLI